MIIFLFFPWKELLKYSTLFETGIGVDSDNAVPISHPNTYYVDVGMASQIFYLEKSPFSKNRISWVIPFFNFPQLPLSLYLKCFLQSPSILHLG